MEEGSIEKIVLEDVRLSSAQDECRKKSILSPFLDFCIGEKDGVLSRNVTGDEAWVHRELKASFGLPVNFFEGDSASRFDSKKPISDENT